MVSMYVSSKQFMNYAHDRYKLQYQIITYVRCTLVKINNSMSDICKEWFYIIIVLRCIHYSYYRIRYIYECTWVITHILCGIIRV